MSIGGWGQKLLNEDFRAVLCYTEGIRSSPNISYCKWKKQNILKIECLKKYKRNEETFKWGDFCLLVGWQSPCVQRLILEFLICRWPVSTVLAQALDLNGLLFLNEIIHCFCIPGPLLLQTMPSFCNNSRTSHSVTPPPTTPEIWSISPIRKCQFHYEKTTPTTMTFNTEAGDRGDYLFYLMGSTRAQIYSLISA